MVEINKSIDNVQELLSNVDETISRTENLISKVRIQKVQKDVSETLRYARRLRLLAGAYVSLVSRVVSRMPVEHSEIDRDDLELIELSVQGFRSLNSAVNSIESSVAQDDSASILGNARIAHQALGVAVTAISDGSVPLRAILDRSNAWTADEKNSALASLESVLQGLDSEGNAVRIRQANVEAQRVLQTVKGTASATGDAKLGQYFKLYADRELSAARLLRYSAALLLVATAVGAAVIVFFLQDKGLQGGIWQQLAKLSVVLPLGILAGYLGRESSKHRNASQWAEEMRVQLLTFDAFTEAMEPSDAKALRAAFGARVFSARLSLSGKDVSAKSLVDTVRDVTGSFRGSV